MPLSGHQPSRSWRGPGDWKRTFTMTLYLLSCRIGTEVTGRIRCRLEYRMGTRRHSRRNQTRPDHKNRRSKLDFGHLGNLARKVE